MHQSTQSGKPSTMYGPPKEPAPRGALWPTSRLSTILSATQGRHGLIVVEVMVRHDHQEVDVAPVVRFSANRTDEPQRPHRRVKSQGPKCLLPSHFPNCPERWGRRRGRCVHHDAHASIHAPRGPAQPRLVRPSIDRRMRGPGHPPGRYPGASGGKRGSAAWQAPSEWARYRIDGARAARHAPPEAPPGLDAVATTWSMMALVGFGAVSSKRWMGGTDNHAVAGAVA